MQAYIYRRFCFCYLACSKFCTMLYKASSTIASDQACSKNKILQLFTVVRWGYPSVCSDWSQSSSQSLQEEQPAPNPHDSACWITPELPRLVERGLCCGWDLPCAQLSIPTCACPVPLNWHHSALLLSGRHLASLSCLGCLLPAKLSLTAGDSASAPQQSFVCSGAWSRFCLWLELWPC